MKDIFIYPDNTIKEALKKLNETSERILFVVDKSNILLGTVTDGDIRRYILRTASIEGKVCEIYNRNPVYATKYLSEKEIKDLIFKNNLIAIPVVDENKKIVKYYKWTDFYEEEKVYKVTRNIEVPVVIMAGGFGLRMMPFTKVLPKPLLPFKNKTIIEHVIDSFRKFGVRNFYVTLNYKGKIIEAYFNSIEKDYNLEFIWEEDFLGTAGSLYYLKNKINSDFFVSNCDVLLDIDYSDVYEYHKNMNATMTIVSSINYYKIPYGVIKIGENGLVYELIEKPEYVFILNTGVYLFNQKVFNYIEKKDKIDMPFLIQILIGNSEKVFSYPIKQNDYIDLGELKNYKNFLFFD